MKVKLYSNHSAELSDLVYNKLYEVLVIEDGLYRVCNETGKEELYPSALFKIVSGKEDDVKHISINYIPVIRILKELDRQATQEEIEECYWNAYRPKTKEELSLKGSKHITSDKK